MGQAKKRGTREQRRAEAIERADKARCARLEAKARQDAETERQLASLTPEQRRRVEAANRRGADWLAIAAMLSGFGVSLPTVK